MKNHILVHLLDVLLWVLSGIHKKLIINKKIISTSKLKILSQLLVSHISRSAGIK